MSNVQANEEVPQDEESGGENETHQLREAYKRKEAEAKEGAAAKRELAFLRAGVDPDASPAAKFFADHYDGELNADAITESYSALGLGGEPAPQPEPEPEVDPQMQEDQATQASCLDTALAEAHLELAARTPGGVLSGQTLFEWSDEWWKAECTPNMGWTGQDECPSFVNPAFPEGIMLAILFGNVFAPAIDKIFVNQNIKRRQLRDVAG